MAYHVNLQNLVACAYLHLGLRCRPTLLRGGVFAHR